MSIASPIRRPRARHAIGIALAATMVATMGVAAQSPSATPAPDAVTPPTRTTDRAFRGHLGRGQGDHRRGGGSWGMRQDGPWSGMRGAAGFGQRGLRPGSGVTVSTNDGTSLVLSTPDGWTRTIDTTGVVLTRDGVAVAIGDIQVGESVRVVQTRNADGSYTVTGIEVQPALAVGTVGTASTDGFTVVGIDGTTTTISVTPETTWSAAGPCRRPSPTRPPTPGRGRGHAPGRGSIRRDEDRPELTHSLPPRSRPRALPRARGRALSDPDRGPHRRAPGRTSRCMDRYHRARPTGAARLYRRATNEPS